MALGILDHLHARNRERVALGADLDERLVELDAGAAEERHLDPGPASRVLDLRERGRDRGEALIGGEPDQGLNRDPEIRERLARLPTPDLRLTDRGRKFRNAGIDRLLLHPGLARGAPERLQRVRREPGLPREAGEGFGAGERALEKLRELLRDQDDAQAPEERGADLLKLLVELSEGVTRLLA